MTNRHETKWIVGLGTSRESTSSLVVPEKAIVMPRSPDQRACVKGDVTVSRRTLGRALHFAELNWEPLVRFWIDATMMIDDLFDEIVPVE
jgi:hypothetical protein